MNRIPILQVMLPALMLLCGGAAQALERWQVLPPTPSLPAGTVGKHELIDGIRIWYAEWGVDNPGTPVLLLHGGYGNTAYFGYLIPDLVQHGFHVLAMDSRGHGRSARGEEPITYHLMATDVLALLDRLHMKQVSLVGWSDGGCIGLDIAIHHPDRLRRLFAFGADADVSGLKDDIEQSPVFGAYLVRVRQEYQALSPTPDEWDAFNASISKMWATLPAYTAAQLRQIPVPTTIADGQYDEGIKPEHAHYLAHTIPHAHLVILPNLSHFAMLQDPQAFDTAVLDFLNDYR